MAPRKAVEVSDKRLVEIQVSMSKTIEDLRAQLAKKDEMLKEATEVLKRIQAVAACYPRGENNSIEDILYEANEDLDKLK
jgi:hypothetical protein